MLSQLSEINSSKELDALEQYLVEQNNKMLDQLKVSQMLMISTLFKEMRFTRDFVNQMADTLNE